MLRMVPRRCSLRISLAFRNLAHAATIVHECSRWLCIPLATATMILSARSYALLNLLAALLLFAFFFAVLAFVVAAFVALVDRVDWVVAWGFEQLRRQDPRKNQIDPVESTAVQFSART
jgi:hypothetical protein